jgi:hypothetical protein
MSVHTAKCVPRKLMQELGKPGWAWWRVAQGIINFVLSTNPRQFPSTYRIKAIGNYRIKAIGKRTRPSIIIRVPLCSWSVEVLRRKIFPACSFETKSIPQEKILESFFVRLPTNYSCRVSPSVAVSTHYISYLRLWIFLACGILFRILHVNRVSFLLPLRVKSSHMNCARKNWSRKNPWK